MWRDRSWGFLVCATYLHDFCFSSFEPFANILAGYLTHHALTFPSPATLQSRIDAYISHFTRLETLRAAALARMRSQIDEDGFTMVVRGGRSAPAKMEEAQAVLEKKRKEEDEKRKGNLGFYRFQRREDKKEEMRRLVERFEGDKKRVEERKGRGKFRVV